MIVQEIQAEQKVLPEPDLPDNYKRVKAYIVEHPGAKLCGVAQAFSISPSTANKWMRQTEQGEIR